MVLAKDQVDSFGSTKSNHKRFSIKNLLTTQFSSKCLRELSPDIDEDEDNDETGITADVPNGDVFNVCKGPSRISEAFKDLKSTLYGKDHFDYDKTSIKDLTSLNFSSLFTFRKHVQNSQEIFFKDYIFLGKIGKGFISIFLIELF